MPENQTLVVNLFAGPGVGKSTTAALLFGRLKAESINAEMVHEFAKDLVWEERHRAIKYQPYVISKQAWHVHRLINKVDVVVTDSPILLGIIYQGEGYDSMFGEHLLWEFRGWNTYNIFLKRNPEAHKYNPAGRSQTEEQAMNLDWKILDLLNGARIPYDVYEVAPNAGHIDSIVSSVKRKIRYKLGL